VRISPQILGRDDKRLHLAHEMFSLTSGRRGATQELMYLHIDLGARRVVPWLPEARERVGAAARMPGSPGPIGLAAISRCPLSTRHIDSWGE
jgi:acyl-CoA thioester hydrolase